MKYAKNTTVSIDRSKEEIEKTLRRYGADQFIYGWDEERAMIGFRVQNRFVRFYLWLPPKDSKEFKYTPERCTERSEQVALKLWEQAVRQKWRALVLVLKAKLEAVESGIATFDSEFLAHLVMPNGRTVGELCLPQIDEAYRTGKFPALLPAPE